jgi:hypothetical protein
MHGVVVTKAFARAAERAGMLAGGVDDLIDFIARNPTAGDEIKGTGGCRKLRVAGRGKGKSGGYRVITFFSGPDIPLFLITMFSKGERGDLSQGERNGLSALTKELVREYTRRAEKVGERG